MATQRRSTILDDIDFKLQLMKHFEKVYYKCVQNRHTQALMLDQSARIGCEVQEMRGNLKLSKLYRKHKLNAWIDFLMNQPVGESNESIVHRSEPVA